MKRDEREDIRAALTAYADLSDAVRRTTARARMLARFDDMRLSPRKVRTRRLAVEELRRDRCLRGALAVHFDLVFRATVTAEELEHTAQRGVACVALHDEMPGLPVGAALALPARGLVRRREELLEGPELADADTLVVFALATNPPRLGAGAALMRALLREARKLGCPKMVAFSPLTGLRARAIQEVEDGGLPAPLSQQLTELLTKDYLPEDAPAEALRWLEAESRRFAAGESYRTGQFHQAMGGRFLGVAVGSDPKATDSMWCRAWFDYPLRATN